MKEEFQNSARRPWESAGVRFVAVVGILLLVGMYAALTVIDIRDVKSLTEETLDFASRHISYYQETIATRRAEALRNLNDKSKGLQKMLSEQGGSLTGNDLREYTRSQCISGVLVLDGERNVVYQYDANSLTAADWAEELSGPDVRDVLDSPRKHYMACIEKKGSSYDVVVSARTDADGLIMAYAKRTALELNSQSDELGRLFEGYSLRKGGSIILIEEPDLNDSGTAGGEEDVILSDDEDIENVGFVCDFSHHRFGLLTARLNNVLCYGGAASIGGYTVCAFFPYTKVFGQRSTVMLSMVSLYIILVLLFYLVRSRDATAQMEREMELNERLQAAADEARRASAAKTDFLRRMSHDIRTPINGIRGMVEIGDHFPEDAEKQADCRRKIWQASDFLLDLVNNVLDMNKLESGELRPEQVPFDLKDVSRDVHTILQPQAGERGLKLSTSVVDLKHTRLVGSPLYLRQILINLGGNAVKYNRPGGSVTVGVRELSATEDEARYLFTVEDTGLGMSEAFQQRLFEPFAQEDTAAHSAYTGTGLGLAITKELVEKMGGAIRFESKQGVGTRFEVELPFPLDKTSAPEQKAPSPEECSLKGMHVLLVEDNELNREIARFILENEGMMVDEAENGRQAVEKFAASKPGGYDVILMDIMMPVMDGLAAARAIRALDRPDAASVPIFAMTANAFADDVAASRAAGMNEHLAKPLDSAKLVEKLRLYRWHGQQK